MVYSMNIIGLFFSVVAFYWVIAAHVSKVLLDLPGSD